MIIQPRNLHKYFSVLAFPVAILEEKSNRVAISANRVMLEHLIEDERVIGIGSWKRIRHLRLNTLSGTHKPSRKFKQIPPSTTFVYDEDLGGGLHLPMFKRHNPHTGQWQPWDENLTFSELRQGRITSEKTVLRRIEMQSMRCRESA